MRYSDLMILGRICPGIKDRNDIVDIIRHELGNDLSYRIESFDFDNKKILLKKDESDEVYEITPIMSDDTAIGISTKREKKEVNNEKFSLTKNITFLGGGFDGVNVSTREKVITTNYTIFFVDSKDVTKNENESYVISKENVGLWVYDNNIINNDNYKNYFRHNHWKSVFDFYCRYGETEMYLERYFLLPDYYLKINANLQGKELVGTRFYNDGRKKDFTSDEIFYDDYKIHCDIYNVFENYLPEMKSKLSLDTSFNVRVKSIDNYLVKENAKKKTKRRND